MTKVPCVYILSSRKNGTLYTGVTSDLLTRIGLHKQGEIDGFSKKYNINQLVYYEFLETMELAIKREKQIKKWNRDWKIRLIVSANPNWQDLYNDICC